MAGASSGHLKLTKGHDFKLSNHPMKEILDISNSRKIVIHPLDFPHVKPKLLISTRKRYLTLLMRKHNVTNGQLPRINQ